MLGGFISITIIQTLTGILLIAIPPNSSECTAFDWYHLSWLIPRHPSRSCEASGDPVECLSYMRFRSEDTLRNGLCIDISTIRYVFHDSQCKYQTVS